MSFESERMLVPECHGRVYAVGHGEPFVTVLHQQRRALNLAAALPYDVGRVGIIGGGVSGVSLFSAATMRNLDCTLFEEADMLLQLFQEDGTRLLHPHIYDWPAPNWKVPWARLPVLDWRAGTGRQVVEQLSEGVELIAKAWEAEDRLRCSTLVTKLDASENGVDVVLDDGTRETFNVVVLCVGFGLEQNLERFDTSSYWDNRGIGRPLPKREHNRVLVSGCGDGGLIDFIRARLKPRRAAEQDGIHAVDQLMLAEIVGPPAVNPETRDSMESLGKSLTDADADAWTLYERTERSELDAGRGPRAARVEADSAVRRFLARRYIELETHPSTRPAIEAINQRIEHLGLRESTLGSALNDSGPSPLRLQSFILNRLVAFRIMRADGLEVDEHGQCSGPPFVQGRLEGGKEQGKAPREPFIRKVGAGQDGSLDEVVLQEQVIARHGPTRGARLKELALKVPRRTGVDPNLEPNWDRASARDDSERWALRRGLLSCVDRDLLELTRVLLQFLHNHRLSLEEDWRGREPAVGNARAHATSQVQLLPLKLDPENIRSLITLSDEMWVMIGRASLVAWALTKAIDDTLGELGELRRCFVQRHVRESRLKGDTIIASPRPLDSLSGVGMRWAHLFSPNDAVSVEIFIEPATLAGRQLAVLAEASLPSEWSVPKEVRLLLASSDVASKPSVASWSENSGGFGVAGDRDTIDVFLRDTCWTLPSLGEPPGTAAKRGLMLFWDTMGMVACPVPASYCADDLIKRSLMDAVPCLALAVGQQADQSSLDVIGGQIVAYGGELAACWVDGSTWFKVARSPNNTGSAFVHADPFWHLRMTRSK